MTVQELLNRIPSQELAEWVAFDEMEPIGFPIQNWWVAAQMCMLANVNRDKKKKPTAFEVQDFLYKPRLRDLEEKEVSNIVGKLW